CSLRNLMSCSRGIRRSWLPGIRYPRSRPLSNHLDTVRGATLQIFATWPVVNTFFIGRHSRVLARASPRRRASAARPATLGTCLGVRRGATEPRRTPGVPLKRGRSTPGHVRAARPGDRNDGGSDAPHGSHCFRHTSSSDGTPPPDESKKTTWEAEPDGT